MVDILELARDDRKLTHLMYKTYISYPMVKDYLRFLVNKGLLDYEKENEVYRTKESGREFLKQSKKIDI